MIRFRIVGLSWMISILIGIVGLPDAQSQDGLEKRASSEFAVKHFADAERDFRELTRSEPTNVVAYEYLGHALFRQEKYEAAITPYEKVLQLEQQGNKLPQKDRRIIVDQLVMSYGMAGELKKAHRLLDVVIQRDPEYPLNYYNLACAYADEGDKDNMLTNLDLAFQRKGNILEGEQMPDPRSDSSFQKYRSDPQFVVLMKKIGFR